jgi:hypothetical protein
VSSGRVVVMIEQVVGSQHSSLARLPSVQKCKLSAADRKLLVAGFYKK